MMRTYRAFGLTLLCAVLLSLPASAIPRCRQCSGFTIYFIGFIPQAQLAAEVYPNPPNSAWATVAAAGRCYSLWSNALAYANGGCQVQVFSSGSGYTYHCLKCGDALGPVLALPPIRIDQAISRATDLVHGDVLTAQLVQFPSMVLEPRDRNPSFKVVQAYEVDVFAGDQIIRVRVDAETGEATVPPQ